MLPFPSQIASGQVLTANPVLSDLQHVASQFNTHTHDQADITGAGAILLPIGGIIQWPGATSNIANLWYCNGATFPVATYPALATACGTWHGGNASIGRIPDVGGRMVVGWGAAAGHADVATIGNNDGVAIASRKPKHKHHIGNGAGQDVNKQGNQAGGGAGAGSWDTTTYGSDSTSSLIDTPAYLVMNFLIRAL